MLGILTEGQFAIHDLKLCFAKSTPNIMQDTDMISDFCRASYAAGGVNRSLSMMDCGEEKMPVVTLILIVMLNGFRR